MKIKFNLTLSFLFLFFIKITAMPIESIQPTDTTSNSHKTQPVLFTQEPQITPIPETIPNTQISQPPKIEQFKQKTSTQIPEQTQIAQPITEQTSIVQTQVPQQHKQTNYIPVGIQTTNSLNIPTRTVKTLQNDVINRRTNLSNSFLPQNNSSVTNEKIENKIKQDKKNKTQEDIILNFENADLKNLSDYMSKIKKINLIPDKTITGVKISLVMREPLTVDGAWNIFLTMLETSGFSIIEEPDAYKIIPNVKKLTQPLPVYINVSEEILPNNDSNIRYVKFLQNIGVNEIRDLLVSMLSTPNSVIAQPEINGLIITDKSLNIKSAMKVINELDQTGLQESVSILKLKMVNASDVKTLFENLIKKPEGSTLARLLGKQAESNIEYFSPTTRIIAEDRTNSLILLGNKKSIHKIEEFIKNNIDVSLKGTESPLHVYELQNTDATQIKEILQEITASPESVAGQEASKYGAVRGGVKYFRPMSFQVDKDGNRLIVSSVDKQDWKMLKKTIKDLDKPQPQVSVETMFVTVDIEDNKQFGGGFHNKKTGQIGKGVDFRGVTFGDSGVSTDNSDLLTNLIKAMDRAAGATILSFGKKDYIWAFLEAIKTQENTSVITQPFITIANNTQAKIESGNRRRIISETSGTTTGYTTAIANTVVTLKPQINLDGIIRFDVNISIKDFTGTSGGDTHDKQVTTNATVANGQVLVLGGFIKTKVIEQRQKTPILGDIPILGWFAKYKKRTTLKQYTFIFIAPTLIKPRTMPGVNLYTKMKLHNATKDINEAIETKKTTDPIHNYFFNPTGESYDHKVVDFANARYQPTTVDIKNDPYYRTQTSRKMKEERLLQSRQDHIASNQKEKIELDKKFLSYDIKKQMERLKSLLSTIKMPSKEKFTNVQSQQELHNELSAVDKKTKNKLKKLLSVNTINKNAIKNNLNKINEQKEVKETNKNKRHYRRHRR